MQIGDPIPELLGVDQHGNTIVASQFAGRKLILYFYPKDSTPGCTAEACSLRDNEAKLLGKGYAIVGVSADSVESHRRFAERQALPFSLIADTDKRLIQAMGVWGEKNLYGKVTMGIVRTTFVVDESGKIVHIFSGRQIKTKTHAEQILQL